MEKNTIEETKITSSLRDVGSSTMTSIEEVGESLCWISYLYTSGILCVPINDGMQILEDGVSLQGLVGVSDDVGIELLPLLTNLPLESLSLSINYFYHDLIMHLKN